MKPIFMYGKYIVIYSKDTGKLLSKKRRLSNKENASTIENAPVVKERKKNKNFGLLSVWTI